jgi:hypothetical protein
MTEEELLNKAIRESLNEKTMEKPNNKITCENAPQNR